MISSNLSLHSQKRTHDVHLRQLEAPQLLALTPTTVTTMKAPTPFLTVAGAEQVTQNPLTFRSTFTIPAKDLLQQCSKVDGQEIRTGVCGLGWTFGVQPLPPSLPDGVQKSIFTAAQKSGRLTIVEPSRQDSIPVRTQSDITLIRPANSIASDSP